MSDNSMERKMLNEVYRRLVLELHRARSNRNEEMVRMLTMELAEIEIALGGGERGLSGIVGK